MNSNLKIFLSSILIFSFLNLGSKEAVVPDNLENKIEEVKDVKAEQKNDDVKISDDNSESEEKSGESSSEESVSQEANLNSENGDNSKAIKDIYFNFEDTELSNFVNYISELKKINLIPDKSLQGVKISLTIREPLTLDGAWRVFLTVLEMSGFSIIKVGDVYKIIPKAGKAKEPLKAYINVPLETLPDSDINIRYVTFLQNVNVGTIQELLRGMLSPEGTVVPYTEVNGMIITDKSYNIKSAMRVVLELDQTGLQESVVVMRLKRANATDVKTLFDSLIKKDEGSPLARLLGKQAENNLQYFSPTTRIIAEERTNSLILLGNRKSIAKIEDFVVNNLDTELKGTESPLHIYELQHTDAESVRTILETVTDVSAIGEQAGKFGAVRGGVKYFKSMKFQVDKDGNRLIVSSTDKQDWRLLKKTINDLDKPQPQVALETMIVSVNLTDLKKLGGSLRNKNLGQIGKGVNFQSPTSSGIIVKSATDPNNLLGSMLNAVTDELGSTIFSFGKDTNIWGVFKALKTETNSSILSQPFFTVANKTKAHIDFGSTINVVNEEIEGLTQFSGFKELSANTEVDITPQINLDGIIRLTIDITISEFTDTERGNRNTKKLKTDVSVSNGQVLALGGFVKTSVKENMNKTPLLGDIPILGWFFKNKSRDIEKDYIFIFISPTIIKPRETPGTNLYTRMKLHNAVAHIDESVQTGKTNDPIHNWFFNPEGENYSHKVEDFANARYQPSSVDIKNDPYYRAYTQQEDLSEDSEISDSFLDSGETKKTTGQEFVENKSKPKDNLMITKNSNLPVSSIEGNASSHTEFDQGSKSSEKLNIQDDIKKETPKKILVENKEEVKKIINENIKNDFVDKPKVASLVLDEDDKVIEEKRNQLKEMLIKSPVIKKMNLSKNKNGKSVADRIMALKGLKSRRSA